MRILIRTLLVIVLVLMLLGALLVFTASGTYSANKFDSIYFLFKSHLWKIFAAIAFMIIFSLIPYDNYRKYSKQLILGILLLLVVTLLFAPKVKGASRWLDLGLFSFQPSELAKIILVMHLSTLIERKKELIKDFKNGFMYALIWVLAVSGLVMMQPNISTSLIIVFSAFTLLYIGGANKKHILATLTTCTVAAGSVMMLLSHSRERILSFISSLSTGGDINMQVKQAKIALGSGGFWGVGIGESRQSDLFLPEAYGDFIFSVLGEEMGFLGTVGILFMFFGLFFVGYLIAKNAKDHFAQLLAFGIIFNIAISAFINAAVVTGLFPTTGITLPFISFGGTSIIIFGISIGIMLNIAFVTLRQRESIPPTPNEMSIEKI